MTIIDAVTAHGRRYRIDLASKLWTRINVHGQHEPVEKIWDLKVGTKLIEPWAAPDTWKNADRPEVGKHLYIAGKDAWYVSTLVQNIVVVPAWNAP